jgi:hypothetical protein
MAKSLLWMMLIFTVILIAVEHSHGIHVELFTKIIFWSLLAVLAICESIEKARRC